MLEYFKGRRLVLVLLAALVVIFLSFLFAKPGIEVVRPERGPAVQGVFATGTVEASVMLPIAARASARLSELLADEGQAVTEGQILGRLESEDLKSNLAMLRSKELLAKQEFQRVSELRADKKVSAQEFDNAKAVWDMAKAAAAQAAALENFMELAAPGAGQIIKRDGEIGQLIPAGQSVFWIALTSPLRISSEVDEEDIALVKVGQAVLIRADAFPGQVFKGKVASITPKGDPIARSYRVRVDLEGQTPLQIGMTTETNIIIRQNDNALLIPSTALQQNQVWLVENSLLRRQDVVLGARGAERTEIVSGIGEDVEVVSRPDSSLREGAKIRTRLRKQ